MKMLTLNIRIFWFALSVANLGGYVEGTAQIVPTYHYQVSYTMLLDFDGHRLYDAVLYVGTSASLFTFQMTEAPPRVGLLQDDDGYRFDIADTTGYFIQSDRAEQRTLHLEPLPDGGLFCVVSEPFENAVWEVTGRRKTIEIFNCEEAKTLFRGRRYTVWFCDELPFAFGPWKLHGLPGLVLEAYDASGEVRFYANSVRKLDTSAAIPHPDFQDYPLMERPEYISIIRSHIDGLERRMMSRFDRSYRVKVSSSRLKSVEIYDQ